MNSFNRSAQRAARHSERPPTTNLRSVPGFGSNERLQQLETIRLEFMNNPG